MISNHDEALTCAVEEWAKSDSEKGEVFTKEEIVNLILTLSGISGLTSLDDINILEPSCGQGEFVIGAVKAILNINNQLKQPHLSRSLAKTIRAYDLVKENVEITQDRIRDYLCDLGYSNPEVDFLVREWVRHGDFLLEDDNQSYSHIIGNPPYLRIEDIPKILLEAYRNKYITMKDRSDLYIAFIEKSLSMLKPNGSLSFICTDRWMKNNYGRWIRKFIYQNYSLDFYIDLYGEDAFQKQVLAYPAITLISRSEQRGTYVAHNPKIDESLLQEVKRLSKEAGSSSKLFQYWHNVVNEDLPWLLGCADETSLVKTIEDNFDLIEKAGCSVYIGAATGNNNVFIINSDINVEDSRKLPVITASEISKNKVSWNGSFIINTYDDNGVISLSNFPLLSKYLNAHKSELSKRHIVQKSKAHWYKTIDRVYPDRAVREKLLIPDIKSEVVVVYDEGVFHPNNSIYYICSDTWNLKALRAVLISGIAKLFIKTYSTKMANGYFRFQAQHLRRIRLPQWESLSVEEKNKLIEVGTIGDMQQAKEIVASLYEFTEDQKVIFRRI